MNLKSLFLFRQIVLTGSLSDAAKVFNLSLSAASRHISMLEQEVGLELFSRDSRRLVLTADGDVFYRRVSPTINGLEEITNISSEIRARSQNWLSVVTAAPMARTLASPALALMAKKLPGLECALNVETRFDIESKVAAKGFSLGVISLPVENAILDLQVEPFLKARMEVMIHRDHPLARYKTIRLEDIADERFVALAPRQRWRDRLDEILGRAGHTAHVPYETGSTVVVMQMVRDGLGIALTDRATVLLRPDDEAVLVPLKDEHWITYAGLHPAGPRAPLSAAFLDAIGDVIETWRKADPAAAQSLELI